MPRLLSLNPKPSTLNPKPYKGATVEPRCLGPGLGHGGGAQSRRETLFVFCGLRV